MAVNGMRNIAVWLIVGLMLITLFNVFQGPAAQSASRNINFSQFIAEVDAGTIADVTIEGDSITGHYSDGASFSTYAPPNDPTLVQRLQERGVSITAKPDSSGSPTLLGVLISWFPMLL
jgi:cell division protease FtsH